MKKMVKSILVGMLFLAVSAVQAQEPLRFRADIRTMDPLGYPSRSVDDFFLEMRGDTLDLYLPYMGEVYSPSFSNDGLNFKTVAEKVVRSKDKKGNDQLTFEARHDNILYSFRISLYQKGNAYVNLIPSNAQSISYSGTWKVLE